ncbi:hypothetical protein [Glaciimonas immobilis]|uniref:Lipoprotein n=1 Tax=Glaciimonas immobilis TaxID=728004 RepID=A0A840RMV0_9BURK|nr:hypothetical protein [Glaciimonas immobilis]KAF3999484.1 hypothetical protein HAV38_06095 [Glaciimonas immobilis]MBB5199005.1 hypothetical protein [Glaciimonas immobilis]
MPHLIPLSILLTSVITMCVLTGCATTGQGNGHVKIEASSGEQSIHAARCVVKTDGGTWTVTTPGEIVISAPDGDLHLKCSKSGYRNAEMTIKGPPGAGVPNMGSGAPGGGGIGLGQNTRIPTVIDGKNSAYPDQVMVKLDPL